MQEGYYIVIGSSYILRVLNEIKRLLMYYNTAHNFNAIETVVAGKGLRSE